MNKVNFVQEVRQAVLEDFPELENSVGSCLYSSLYTVLLLGKKHGIKAILQAGTMGWRVVKPELDNGIGITHFSFQWSPDTLASKIAVATGNLPEMHVWVGIPDTQELIDINTNIVPKFLQLMCPEQVWSADMPPDFLWTSVKGWSHDCYYEPVMEATVLAQRVATYLLRANKEKIANRLFSL